MLYNVINMHHKKLITVFSFQLILIRKKSQEFHFKNNTKQDYTKFCDWQSSYNSDNFESRNHYDMAILFTTRTLYSDGRIVQG